MPGTLFVVATPIGNLEDVTVRALRVLREVSIIAAEDTRRTAHLLARYGIPTPTTSLHEHNEARKSSALVARLTAGESVAVVSDAGTPTVSDPGHRLIAAAIAAGVRVEPIPGPSAILAALVASGVTTDTFSFLGFPPTRSKDRGAWFAHARRVGGTIVFFEAPHRIQRTLEDLLAIAGDCQVTVARELTKVHEELVRGPISTLLNKTLRPQGEFTIVAEFGLSTESRSNEPLSPARLLAEFGEMTKHGETNRRRAITKLAARHRLAPNQLYAALEEAKKSVNRPT